jgi:hypothetical protein
VAGLRAQTLPLADWELLIFGDEPTQAAASQPGLTWHPQLRQIIQPPNGIAAARLRALREFLAGPSELMVFLDDDNRLAPDFLATGLALGRQEPRLGCWGGQLIPQFDVPPPDWMPPFYRYLAIFPLERELRATVFNGNYDCVPPTAGMFLRRAVAEHFVKMAETQPHRRALGGTPKQRIGAEDMDIGLSALDLGLELARFPQLKLTHLIPADRLTESYVCTLLTNVRAGTLLLEAFRHSGAPPRSSFALWRDWLRTVRLPPPHRSFRRAELRGERIARRILADIQLPPQT